MSQDLTWSIIDMVSTKHQLYVNVTPTTFSKVDASIIAPHLYQEKEAKIKSEVSLFLFKQ